MEKSQKSLDFGIVPNFSEKNVLNYAIVYIMQNLIDADETGLPSLFSQEIMLSKSAGSHEYDP
jgi:hypothetical protein